MPVSPPLNTPNLPAPWWRAVWRHVWANIAICLLIAVLISAVFRDNLWRNIVFSLCIGLSIQGLIEVGMVGISRLRLALGHRGPALASRWPGWAWMAPWALLSALAGHSLGMALAGWLTSTAVNPLGWLSNPRPLFVVLSLTLGVTLGFTLHFYNEGRLAAARSDTEAAQRLATEHQLKLLQTQLEPHMLFNSLANLRVLIGLDPPRAQTMLDHMVAYLRATLSASRTDSHPLAAEFDRLQDYLALMAIRMGPRLQVAFDLPEDLRQLPVPPLLLQPLVENSIKHGLEPKLEGGRLLVSARREGQRLHLTVRDTGVGLPAAGPAQYTACPAAAEPAGASAAKPSAAVVPAATPATATAPTDPRPAGSGFGTQQVRQRLLALHGGSAQFNLQPAPDAEGGTLATIDLPCP